MTHDIIWVSVRIAENRSAVKLDQTTRRKKVSQCLDNPRHVYLKCLPSQLQTEFNQLLVALCVCDLLNSAFGIPVDFAASLQLGWKLGQPLCVFTGFALTFLGKLH